MMLLGVLVIFSFGISGVPAPAGHVPHALSKFCYSCHKIGPSEVCTNLEKCHAEGVCRVEVTQEHHGGLVFTYGCVDKTECEAPTLVGKRAPHDQLKCRECCTTDSCNKHLCGAFATSVLTTSSATAQVTTTQAPPTTTKAPPAHVSVVLTEAPTTAMPIFIVTDVITQPSTAAPSTAAPSTAAPERECVDIESDGFKCSSFDQFNFCTDPTSFAHSLAQEHCRAHCGICTSTVTDAPPQVSTGGVITAAPVATGATAQVIPASTGGVITAAPVATGATAQVIPASTGGVITAAPVATGATAQVIPASTGGVITAAPVATGATAQVIPASTGGVITAAPATGSPPPVSTGGVITAAPAPADTCLDHEEDGVTCASLGKPVCADTNPIIHQMVKAKCPKYCGFCTPSSGGVTMAAFTTTTDVNTVIPTDVDTTTHQG